MAQNNQNWRKPSRGYTSNRCSNFQFGVMVRATVASCSLQLADGRTICPHWADDIRIFLLVTLRIKQSCFRLCFVKTELAYFAEHIIASFCQRSWTLRK